MSTRTEIAEGLAEILEDVAGVNPADVAEDKTLADDLDVDSLSFVEVVVSAEERFDVRLSDEQCEACKTVGDLVTLVEKAQADS